LAGAAAGVAAAAAAVAPWAAAAVEEAEEAEEAAAVEEAAAAPWARAARAAREGVAWGPRRPGPERAAAAGQSQVGQAGAQPPQRSRARQEPAPQLQAAAHMAVAVP